MRYKRYIFILTIFSIILLIYTIFKDDRIALANPKKPDQCITCHSDFKSMDNSHPFEVMGCAVCHGGNAFALKKQIAHQGMVLNPARLEHASIFCAKCHKDIVYRVKHSLMQTQNGIKKVLDLQWNKLGKVDKNLTKDHYTKMCAACHIDQDEKVFYNQKIAKGGGCSDCHRLSKTKEKKHAIYSTKIPSKNCLKCHNRSNRIGLSYMGIFESEGYGTPYKKAHLTHKMSDNRRYYYHLPSDIHHKIAKLDCIDCHTEKGVMGDGKKHNHMEEAEDIKCKDCHKPKFKKPNALAITLIELNEKVPLAKKIAYTNRFNSPLYNIQKDKSAIKLYRKRDGKEFNITKMSDKPYHSLSIHKRLDCSACHSSWMPSCYGCHEVYLDKGKQFDWVAKKVTKGQWQEFRSFLRWEKPSLGVGYNGKVMPFAPGCQVLGTIFKDKKVKKFHSMAMAGWDPHTTQKGSRSCEDCHFEPATLGLGRGVFDIKKGKVVFEPFYDSRKSGMPFSYPLDAFISKDGKQFQTTSRKKARGFNKGELLKIVNAYKCIICHDSYSDKIYRDFNRSKRLFYSGKTKCLE